MKITKWLAVLAVFSIMVAPALSANAMNGCTCTSGDNKSSHAMNCCDKCSDEFYYSKEHTCHCQISPISSADVSDLDYSYFGRGSSRPYVRDGQVASSSNSGSGSAYLSSSWASSDGIGPPDLDVIEYLPPSARLVFDVLASCGPQTQKDLITKTDLPPRTVRYALGRLKEESVIRECFYFPDARQSLYGLNTVALKAGQI